MPIAKLNMRFKPGERLSADKLNAPLEKVDEMVEQMAIFDGFQNALDSLSPDQTEALSLAQKVNTLYDVFGMYEDRTPIALEAAQAGKAIVPIVDGSVYGKVGTYEGAVVSKEYTLTRGDMLLMKTGKTSNAIFTVSQVTTSADGNKTYTKVMSLNELAEVPTDGYLRFLVMPSDMTIVVTYFPSEPTFEATVRVKRCGAFASISTQVGNIYADLTNNYMRKDGYSAGARVGSADNLTSRGEASAEEFVSRIAGGSNSIEDGDARIVRVKGKTLKVWQMWCNSSGVMGVWATPRNYLTYTKTDRGCLIEANSNVTMSNSLALGTYNWGNRVVGHKYFSCIHVTKNTFAARWNVQTGFGYSKWLNVGSNTLFHEATTNIETSAYYIASVVEQCTIGETLEYDWWICIDLTELGLDHCTTADQVAQEFGFATWDAFASHPSFEQLMAYSETPRLINSHVEGVRTTYTDDAGQTQYSERKWTDTMERCFPDGMKSAGSAEDEFTSTKATARIAKKVFDGTEKWGFWSDYGVNILISSASQNSNNEWPNILSAGYTTNVWFKFFSAGRDSGQISMFDKILGVATELSPNDWEQHLAELYAAGTPFTIYYELAEPIVTEYDELNLSERVAVGGMEEAIVPEGVESAPLRADIIYPIDAYNTIKRNKANIEELGQKPAISLTADEVARLRAMINVSTQSEGGER